ncbi:hypothetical protein [Kitasatospora paracochleata]|nr:hypothetical protein [Kitasatospora paracochleata]
MVSSVGGRPCVRDRSVYGLRKPTVRRRDRTARGAVRRTGPRWVVA